MLLKRRFGLLKGRFSSFVVEEIRVVEGEIRGSAVGKRIGDMGGNERPYLIRKDDDG